MAEHTLAVLLNNLASTREKLRMPREAPAPVEALLLGQALTPLCPPRARRQRRCTSGRSSSAASTWSRTTRAWRTSVRSSRSCSRGSSPSPAGGGRESSDALGDGGGEREVSESAAAGSLLTTRARVLLRAQTLGQGQQWRRDAPGVLSSASPAPRTRMAGGAISGTNSQKP